MHIKVYQIRKNARAGLYNIIRLTRILFESLQCETKGKHKYSTPQEKWEKFVDVVAEKKAALFMLSENIFSCLKSSLFSWHSVSF